MDSIREIRISPERRKRYRTTIIAACLWGIAAHGYMMSHKISFHDDVVSSFYLGGTYGMGRFVLGIFGKLLNMFGGNYSLPLFNGIISVLLIALAACFLVDMFGLKKNSTCIALSGIMVTIPAVASLFGYMFTSFPYMFGMLLSVVGVYVICDMKHMRKGIRFSVGSVLICLATGVYQPYFALAAALMLLFMIIGQMVEAPKGFAAFFREACYLLASLICALLLYAVLNQLFLRILGMTMYEYPGVAHFGIVEPSEYMGRILTAYREFFAPRQGTAYHVYPFGTQYLYLLVLLATVGLIICRLRNIFRTDIRKGIQCVILLCLFPLAVNLIFVLAEADSVYALMMYGQIVFFLLFVWLLEHIKLERAKPASFIQRSGIVILLFISLWFCRYDNTCYLKMDYLQSRAVSYFHTMITRIESIEGYHDEMPVTFVNATEKKDENMTVTEEFRNITIMPYSMDSLINNYAWLEFVKQWCGYDPFVIDGSLYESFDVVKSMPSYPDDGSIQIVEGVIVVKF